MVTAHFDGGGDDSDVVMMIIVIEVKESSLSHMRGSAWLQVNAKRPVPSRLRGIEVCT